MACNWKTANRREKLGEIWDLYMWVVVTCIWGTIDLLVFRVVWGLFSNSNLNKLTNKLFILVVWISIEKSNIERSLTFPEGRVFNVPLGQCLGVRYFTCTLTTWSMGYLICPKGRISDLPPGQGVWPAPRAGSLIWPEGRISDLPPGQGVWPNLRAWSLAWPEAGFSIYP